ncbi:MAG: DUF6198 family protein [Fermentimonas sp.]|jgi:uncharacterized membrane protein YczE
MKRERTILLLLGIFVIAHGVAMSIKSDLGTTPIASVPYVLSLIIPNLTVGTFTIIFNLLMLLIQIIILKGKLSFTQYIQIPLLILFGLFIDFNLFLTKGLVMSGYWMQLLTIVWSCFAMAFGVFLELKSDIGYLPGDGLTFVISDTYDKDFGKTKVGMDISVVLIAIILAFVFTGGLAGVREGTIIAAIFVGVIVRFFQKNIRWFDYLESKKALSDADLEPYMTTNKFVITIARQYGSGGHEVGELIAKKLGVAFYDSKLIDLTSIATGFTPEYVEEYEQRVPYGLLDRLYINNYAFTNEVIPPNDKLFIAQTEVIRKIAASESCVIVGRSANYILKGHKNLFNVFVHADDDFRRKRVMWNYMVRPELADKVMATNDYERDSYSLRYTGKHWDDMNQYDMTVDTSKFGIEKTVDMIIEASRSRLKGVLIKEENE